MSGGTGGGSSLTRIYLFVLVLNLVFPVLGYTFTSFGSQSERYELSLDPDSLMIIGINLVDGESHTLTFGAAEYDEYQLLNVSLRARWARHRIPGTLNYEDNLRFQKRSTVSQAFDSWLLPYLVRVKSIASNEWFWGLRNETIIRDFDSIYNWSRFVLTDGHHVFVTPTTNHGNITLAVFGDQELNVTIAKSFEEAGERFNFWRFVGWYSSILIGDQSWGLPAAFSWVIRILGGISIFAVIMLTRELIGFT